MENGMDDLKKMSSHQLLVLRQTLEKARDDKLIQLKQLEVESKATIETLKRVLLQNPPRERGRIKAEMGGKEVSLRGKASILMECCGDLSTL